MPDGWYIDPEVDTELLRRVLGCRIASAPRSSSTLRRWSVRDISPNRGVAVVGPRQSEPRAKAPQGAAG